MADTARRGAPGRGMFEVDRARRSDGRPSPLSAIEGRWSVKHRLATTVLAPVAAAWSGDRTATPPTGVLLYGPAGSDLDEIVDAVAADLGVGRAVVDLEEVLDQPGTETGAEMAGALFRRCGQGPSVVRLDGFDRLCVDGERPDDWVRLAHGIDELQSGAGHERILLFATSDVPWAHNAAMFVPGRLDRLVFVPPPDRDARAERIRTRLVEHGLGLGAGADLGLDDDAGDALVDELVLLSEGWTGADVDAVFAVVDDHGRSPATPEALLAAARGVEPTSGRWLGAARAMANFAVDHGMVDDLMGYLRRMRLA